MDFIDSSLLFPMTDTEDALIWYGLEKLESNPPRLWWIPPPLLVIMKYDAANKKTANQAYSSYSFLFRDFLPTDCVGFVSPVVWVDGWRCFVCVSGVASLLMELFGTAAVCRLLAFLRRLISPAGISELRVDTKGQWCVVLATYAVAEILCSVESS